VAAGRLALALGEVAEARQWLAAAARDNPGEEEAQYYAGLAFLAGPAADREQAIEYFKAATRADPHQPRAGVALGRLLFEMTGQPERAAEVYRRALSMDAQYMEAEEGLVRVRAVLKQPAEVVYHQARVRELMDRPDEALALYRRWCELRPERWDGVLRTAECLMDMERYQEAAREVQSGLERFPSHPELFSHLAQLYLRTGNRPDAARLCRRWAPLDRTSGRPEWIQGQLASQSLRSEEAIRWYEAAVRKNPDLGVYHAALGEALAREPSPERLRQARAALERATALHPIAGAFHQLGLVLQQMGDLESARQAFLRGLGAEGSPLECYRGLMSVARRLGRPGAAAFFTRLEREVRDQQRDEAAARRRLWTRPRDAQARLAFARLLLRRGEFAEARNHLEVAAEQPDGAVARSVLRRVERLQRVL
jgi:protein O-GlcNAc transferase